MVPQQYITNEVQELSGVAVGQDDSIVAGGAFYNNTVDGPSDFTVVKYFANGTFMWQWQVSTLVFLDLVA